ncbi:MAG: hypothetical protein CDV28_1107 [Candidatus Electronema aureum]|uniref:Thioredoxin domain-containing protein n=1 Tax=Candidatus Electronema aureum TaxID=2005002 RepID=A0A521G295_9BACT|nr:MAG: hypothetical protein CDV28_1107 [Candidatus Electronema aureum]
MSTIKSKSIAAVLLALFIAAGGSFAESAAETSAAGSSQPPAAAQKTEQSTTRVYYFHGNQRCTTCKKIEALTKKTVEESFAGQLKDGSMEVQVVNVDKSENEHFVEEYQLATRSVVVSQIKQGKEAKWRRLDKVWQLVHDEAAFAQYLRDEINLLLNGKG